MKLFQDLQTFENYLVSLKYNPRYVDESIRACEKFVIYKDKFKPDDELETSLVSYFSDVFNKNINDYECELTAWQSVNYRHVKRFIDYENEKEFKLRYLRVPKRIHNQNLTNQLKNYKNWLGKRYAVSTQIKYFSDVENVCQVLCLDGFKDVTDIRPHDVLRVIKKFKKYKARSVNDILCAFKSFFRYLNEEKGYNINTYLLGGFISDAYSPIPSRWSPEDIEKLLGAIDRDSELGKRNWAMLKLAHVYGIRASDIRNLQFADIDWQAHKISFSQSKTKKRVNLPLFKEIGWALIDYIKNGRPESNSNYIFVRHIPPFSPFKDGQTFWHIINLYIKKADLDIHHKKGFHSLRSTLATDMISTNIDLPIVSDTLGHNSINSTKCYIRSNIENLRECPLNIKKFIL